MSSVLQIAVILLAAIALWFAILRGLTRPALFRTSGLAYLKTLLLQRGVDASRIPDAALFEIVKSKIAVTRKAAYPADTKPQRRQASILSFRLARALEAEANLIVQLVTDGPQRQPDSAAVVALRKHGVLAPVIPPATPWMTSTEFSEAVKNGTLYTELTLRLNQRKQS